MKLDDKITTCSDGLYATGSTTFSGTVDFSNATVEGLPPNSWNGGNVTNLTSFSNTVEFMSYVDFSMATQVAGLDTGDKLLASVKLTTTLQSGSTTKSTFGLTKAQRVAMEDTVKYIVYKPNSQDRYIFPLISTNHVTPDQTVNMVFGAVQYIAGAGAMYKEVSFGPSAMFSVSGETGIAIAVKGLGDATMEFFTLASGGTIQFWGR